MTSGVDPESCATCHSEIGDEHQAVYDDYTDASTLTLTIDDVSSLDNGDGTFDTTMTFTIEKDGLPYIDADGLPSLEQKRYYAVIYDSATETYDNSVSFSDPIAWGGGQYTVTASGITYAPELSNAQVYAYIADGLLDTESGGHVHMYDDVASASMAWGDADVTDPDAYESAAVVSGCEKCHGTPYMKHGYRAAAVDGIPDFAACKSCHYDTRSGGHEDWQILVDDPARYAEIHAGDPLTPAEEAKYAYTANIMNDVHMSHAMEFPYPQSMANCDTCHHGKLGDILTDENFTLTTCKSCHAVTGSAEYGTDTYALETIIPHLWDNTTQCNFCHVAGSIVAPPFSEIHTGYNKEIYADAAGQKYADAVTVSIDAASLSVDNVLDIQFSAAESPDLPGVDVATIVPTVMVGLYGWDTKDFIVGPHERDDDHNRLLEFAIDGETENPRFTVISAGGGSWEIEADLSMWADMMAVGTVKRAEIAVLPDLEDADGDTVALNAPSRTFDLLANDFVDYFDEIVDVDGCNVCHDALATTFHSGNRGGNVTVCRMCHITKSGGSHLEMQSRSIDSYVHAIHSFQDFDIGDIDFTDPVEALWYELHIEHVYPNFTIKNCESCHNPGTYNVPDQTKSMPGLFSRSDTVANRNIYSVPEYVSGPGSRACGACHRAEFIKEDLAGDLASFNQHTKTFGYLKENDEEDKVLYAIISYIQSMFN
jgi:OmcA/MtrC family decaheme c-type cytochrome